MAEKKKKENVILEKDDLAGRKKALQKAMDDIEKDYGKGSIMRLGDFKVEDIEAIPTGALSLDVALGVGGIPRGRIIEIYGPESSGKTTLTLHIVAEVQKLGGEAAFIDAEHALDPIYAKRIGVDIDRLIVAQPNNGEEALEIAEKLIRSSAIDLIVVDSVAALVPKSEIEGNMGDAHMAVQARLMSQALRKIAGLMNKTHTTVIFINQLREKVGVLYGSPEVTPGGRALKFYSSVRIDIRRGEQMKEGGNIIGNKTKVKVVKNKLAPPFQEAMLDMIYGKGIDKESSIIDLAIDFGIIEKAGSWFSYNGEKIGQGREKVKEFMKENLDAKNEIEQAVREKAKTRTSFTFEEDTENVSEEVVETEE